MPYLDETNCSMCGAPVYKERRGKRFCRLCYQDDIEQEEIDAAPKANSAKGIVEDREASTGGN